MFKAIHSAVFAAVAIMSSVSAQAMEFGDRPGLSSIGAIEIASVGDISRRQIGKSTAHGIDERTGLIILNTILAKFNETEGPGRLSAEFVLANARTQSHSDRPSWTSTGRVQYGPTVWATVRTKTADRIVTSSVRKTTIPYGLHRRPNAATFASGPLHRILP